jgi:hypothetical protein
VWHCRPSECLTPCTRQRLSRSDPVAPCARTEVPVARGRAGATLISSVRLIAICDGDQTGHELTALVISSTWGLGDERGWSHAGAPPTRGRIVQAAAGVAGQTLQSSNRLSARGHTAGRLVIDAVSLVGDAAYVRRPLPREAEAGQGLARAQAGSK